MKILIATRGRAHGNKLLSWLNSEHGADTILFVEPQEFELYRVNFPNCLIMVLRENNRGLSYVRNAIYQDSVAMCIPYFWMFDDDIRGFYDRDGNKMIKCDNQWEKLVDMQAQFLEQGFAHAGLEYQQFAWSATKPFVIDSFCDNAVWFNMPILTKLLTERPYRPELKIKVDRDFCMQVVAAGGVTARSTLLAFATPKDGSNAGGMKELVYDQPGWEEEGVDTLIRIWGADKVTKFVKDDGRVDAKIHWNKLKKPKQNENELFGGLFQ